jgi:hypothetical protein
MPGERDEHFDVEEFPRTDRAFDMFRPEVSPSTQWR